MNLRRNCRIISPMGVISGLGRPYRRRNQASQNKRFKMLRNEPFAECLLLYPCCVENRRRFWAILVDNDDVSEPPATAQVGELSAVTLRLHIRGLSLVLRTVFL